MDDAPWSVVVLGILFGAVFMGVGLMGAIDWRGWNTAQSQRHADLFRLQGARRDRYLRSQRVLGRVFGPVFVLAGAFLLLAPILSRLV